MKCKNVTVVSKAMLLEKRGVGKSKVEFASDSAACTVVNQSEKASAGGDRSSTRSDTVLSIVSNITQLSVEKEMGGLKEDLHLQVSRNTSPSSEASTTREYCPDQNGNDEQHLVKTTKEGTSKLKVYEPGELQHLCPPYKSGLDEEYETKREYVSRIRVLRKRLKTKTGEMKRKELKLIRFSDELLAEVEAGRRELSGLKLENEDMTKAIKNVQTEKSIIEGKLAKSLERIKSLEKESSAS